MWTEKWGKYIVTSYFPPQKLFCLNSCREKKCEKFFLHLFMKRYKSRWKWFFMSVTLVSRKGHFSIYDKNHSEWIVLERGLRQFAV